MNRKTVEEIEEIVGFRCSEIFAEKIIFNSLNVIKIEREEFNQIAKWCFENEYECHLHTGKSLTITKK